jgi:hypothetical protein
MNVTRCSRRRAWAIEVATQIIEDESFLAVYLPALSACMSIRSGLNSARGYAKK